MAIDDNQRPLVEGFTANSKIVDAKKVAKEIATTTSKEIGLAILDAFKVGDALRAKQEEDLQKKKEKFEKDLEKFREDETKKLEDTREELIAKHLRAINEEYTKVIEGIQKEVTEAFDNWQKAVEEGNKEDEKKFERVFEEASKRLSHRQAQRDDYDLNWDEAYDKASNEISKSVDDLVEVFAEENSPEKLKENGKTFGTAVGDSIVSAFSTILSSVTTMFNEAVDNTASIYENTFGKVSVLTGVDRNSWAFERNNIIDDLREQGLTGVFDSNDIWQAEADLISKGFTSVINGIDARTQAENNLINKKLNPYLDETSQSWINLTAHNKISEESIVGMPKYFQDMGLNTNLLDKTLNDLVTKMEPVSLWAEEELFSEQELATVQSIVDAGYMTEAQAINFISQASDVIANPYQALTGGSLDQKIAVATGQYGNMSQVMQSMMQTALLADTGNVLTQGGVLSRTGQSGYISSYADIDKIVSLYNSNYKKYENSDYTAEDAYYAAFKALTGKEYNTLSDIEKNYVSNTELVTFAAYIKEQMPILSMTISQFFGNLTSSITSGNLLANLGSSSPVGLAVVGGIAAAALTAEGIKEGYSLTTGDVGDSEKAAEYGPVASASFEETEEETPIASTAAKGIGKLTDWLWEKLGMDEKYGSSEHATGGYALSRADNITIGEAGREVILPLDNNTEWAEILAEKLATNGQATINNNDLIVAIKECCSAIISEMQNNSNNGNSNGTTSGFINNNSNNSIKYLKRQFT